MGALLGHQQLHDSLLGHVHTLSWLVQTLAGLEQTSAALLQQDQTFGWLVQILGSLPGTLGSHDLVDVSPIGLGKTLITLVGEDGSPIKANLILSYNSLVGERSALWERTASMLS